MKVLSIDIGASSGRFIVTDYSDSFVSSETYRFPNGQKMINGHLHWDLQELLSHIREGLKVTLSSHKDIASLSVDTWGCDYCLIKNDELVRIPFAYRDERNIESQKEYLSEHSYKEIYDETGIQNLPFNTVYQLRKDVQEGVDFDCILMIPDYINYFLTGVKGIELTNLSTAALYNPKTRSISEVLLKQIGLSKDKFPQLLMPSTKIGSIKKELVDELGIYSVPVVTCGSHDTASAVASIKLDDTSAYLSSGTWSLLGVENLNPIITEKSFESNFTNEIGLEHTFRFLKNIMGLFIVQELRKDFLKDIPNLSFQEMQDEAFKVKDNNIFIDVNDEYFQKPGDMLSKYFAYLSKTKQAQKGLTIGQIVRSVYESMAFKYKDEIENLEKITGKKYQKLVIIGGGAKATTLNQIVADVLGIEVTLGEGEATVAGNCLAQLIGLGAFKSLDEARIALAKGKQFPIFKPQRNYNEQYRHYKEVTND